MIFSLSFPFVSLKRGFVSRRHDLIFQGNLVLFSSENLVKGRLSFSISPSLVYSSPHDVFSFIFPILAEESICGIQEHEFEAPKMANDDEKKIHVKHRICYCYFCPLRFRTRKRHRYFFKEKTKTNSQRK